MPIDETTIARLRAFLIFFSDCRRKDFAKNAPDMTRRFLELDRALALEEASCPATADVCGRRIELPPVHQPIFVHPAHLELFGLLEELDDEELENRVGVNLRTSAAELYLSECESKAPDGDFLSFIEAYLHFCVYSPLAWDIAYALHDEACLPLERSLACLHGCAQKEGSREARAHFALAAFARRGEPCCPKDYPAQAAALLKDGEDYAFFLDEVLDNVSCDELRERIAAADKEARSALLKKE